MLAAKVIKQKDSSVGSSTFDQLIGLKHIIVNEGDHVIPPKIGTLGRRFPNEAMPPRLLGPECQLCHRCITESKCIRGETGQFHVWHFYCSFCCAILSEKTFVVARDNKPYCANCFKRMYPKDPTN